MQRLVVFALVVVLFASQVLCAIDERFVSFKEGLDSNPCTDSVKPCASFGAAFRTCKSDSHCTITVLDSEQVDLCSQQLPFTISVNKLTIQQKQPHTQLSFQTCHNQQGVSSLFVIDSSVKELNLELIGLSFASLVPNTIVIDANNQYESISTIAISSCSFTNSVNVTVLSLQSLEIDLDQQREFSDKRVTISGCSFTNVTARSENYLVDADYFSVDVFDNTLVNVSAKFISWRTSPSDKNELNFIHNTIEESDSLVRIETHKLVHWTDKISATIRYLNNTILGSNSEIQSNHALLAGDFLGLRNASILIENNVIAGYVSLDTMFAFSHFNKGLTVQIMNNDVRGCKGSWNLRGINELSIIRNDIRDLSGQITIEDSETVLVTNNTFAGYGGLFAEAQFVRVQYNEIDLSSRSAISIYNSTHVYIADSSFTRNRGLSGGALKLELTEKAEIERVQFGDNSATKFGGAVMVIDSTVSISECNFARGRAQAGGCLSTSHSDIEVRSSRFDSCTTEGSGTTPYSESFLREHSGGAALLYLSKHSFFDTSFYDNSCGSNGQPIGNGGAVQIFDAFTKSIFTRCIFRRNTAVQGGAISAYKASPIPDMRVLISGPTTLMENSAASYGGAIVTDGPLVATFAGDLIIRDNRAQYGGFLATFEKLPEFEITSNQDLQIQDNIATVAGALIYADFEVTDLSKLDFLDSFKKNSASGYGIRATKPTNLAFYGNPFNGTGNSIILSPNTKFSIDFSLRDSYGQFVRQYPDIPVDLRQSADNYLLYGTGQEVVRTEQGVATFKDLYTECLVGNTYSAVVRSSKVPNRALSFNYVCDVCRAGYRTDSFNTTSTGRALDYNTCTWCPEGSYNLLSNLTYCRSCPAHARCQGNIVISDKGFWSTTDKTRAIALNYFCPSGHCLGNNICGDNRDPNQPICGACKEGYSLWDSRCIKCSKDAKVNPGHIIGYIFSILLAILFNHITSQHPASSSASKIFFFYVQTVVLLLPARQWIQWVTWRFSFHHPPFVVRSGPLNNYCPFARDGYYKLLSDIIQQTFIWALPVGLVVLFYTVNLITFIIRSLISKRSGSISFRQDIYIDESSLAESSYSKITDTEETLSVVKRRFDLKLMQSRLYTLFVDGNAYVMTFFHCLLLTYQGISQATFSFFSCAKYGSDHRVITNTDIVCYSERYRNWTPFYSIVMSYMILAPLVILVTVCMVRRYRSHAVVLRTVGFFYFTYKPLLFWYEAFAIGRRFVIIAIFFGMPAILSNARFDGNYRIVAPGVMIGLLMFSFLVVQRLLSPFNTKLENTLEELSLITLTLVAWIFNLSHLSVFQPYNHIVDIIAYSIALPVGVVLFIYYVVSNLIIRVTLARLYTRIQTSHIFHTRFGRVGRFQIPVIGPLLSLIFYSAFDTSVQLEKDFNNTSTQTYLDPVQLHTSSSIYYEEDYNQPASDRNIESSYGQDNELQEGMDVQKVNELYEFTVSQTPGYHLFEQEQKEMNPKILPRIASQELQKQWESLPDNIQQEYERRSRNYSYLGADDTKNSMLPFVRSRPNIKRMTSYMLFAKQMRPELSKQNMSGPEASVEIRRLWDQLSDEAKDTYETAAMDANALLEAELGEKANDEQDDSEETQAFHSPNIKRMTGYILFSKQHRPELENRLPRLQVNEQLRAMWDKLSEEEKRRYENMAMQRNQELADNRNRLLGDKRKTTPFKVFAKDMRKNLVQNKPNIDKSGVSEELRQLWEKLSPQVRQKYVELAEKKNAEIDRLQEEKRLTGYKLFSQEQAQTGASKQLTDKKWESLVDTEKEKYDIRARELTWQSRVPDASKNIRRMSAYMLFARQFRPGLEMQNPNAKQFDISRALANYWRALPEDIQIEFDPNEDKSGRRKSMLASDTLPLLTINDLEENYQQVEAMKRLDKTQN